MTLALATDPASHLDLGPFNSKPSALPLSYLAIPTENMLGHLHSGDMPNTSP